LMRRRELRVISILAVLLVGTGCAVHPVPGEYRFGPELENVLGLIPGDAPRQRATYELQRNGVRDDVRNANSLGVTTGLVNLGMLYLDDERYEYAQVLLEKALAISKDNGDRIGLFDSVIGLGGIYEKRKKYGLARVCYERALRVSEEPGARAEWKLDALGGLT